MPYPLSQQQDESVAFAVVIAKPLQNDGPGLAWTTPGLAKGSGMCCLLRFMLHEGHWAAAAHNIRNVLYSSHAHILFFITHPVPLPLTATKCKSSTFYGWVSQILVREVRLRSASKDVHR